LHDKGKAFPLKNKKKRNLMQQSKIVPARKYAKGMGKAVADRTVNRRFLREFKRKTWIKVSLPYSTEGDGEKAVEAWIKDNDYKMEKYVVTANDGVQQVMHAKVLVSGRYETEEWEDVAHRVASGNASLMYFSGNPDAMDDELEERHREYMRLNHHLRQASIILSGRHLQHGDDSQPGRNQEVFTNCSTAACSFISFYLLLNGSGVGRCYDDDMMLVDWDKMPKVVCVIERSHKDVLSGEVNVMTPADAQHFYAHKTIHTFRVPDSREGWAKAVEQIEVMAFRKGIRGGCTTH
jgi:hypothetical protein